MIETETDSTAALSIGMPALQILPPADGIIEVWDSANLCGCFFTSGAPAPELIRMRLYAAGTFEDVS